MKNILMIVGSMRKNSFNRRLAQKIEELLSGYAAVSYLEYSDLPYMNQDIEFPTPESVKRVRAAVLEADGIWICTPEYNHDTPGVLKNLLDWLSRPLAFGDSSRSTAVKNKPVTLSGAAGKSASADVRRKLKEVLESMSMNVVYDAGTGISLNSEAFKSDVLSFSDETVAALKKQAEAFIEAI